MNITRYDEIISRVLLDNLENITPPDPAMPEHRLRISPTMQAAGLPHIARNGLSELLADSLDETQEDDILRMMQEAMAIGDYNGEFYSLAMKIGEILIIAVEDKVTNELRRSAVRQIAATVAARKERANRVIAAGGK